MSIELTRELGQWLFDRFEEGASPQQIAKALRDQRYTESQITELLHWTFEDTDRMKERIDSFDFYAEKESMERKKLPFTVSAPIVVEPNNFITAEHGNIRLILRSQRPYVYVFENFLSDQECDEMIAMSMGKTERAMVVNRDTGGNDVDERRTSRNVMYEVYQNELLERIEKRIAQVTKIPVEFGEGLQIMHYGIGAEYQPHQDFFDLQFAGELMQREFGGNRTATLIMYLNNVEAGGSTVFPHAGLEVFPQKGCALYFAYTSPDGINDEMSFHGGTPVVHGEKWIATKWLRESATPWGAIAAEKDKAAEQQKSQLKSARKTTKKAAK